MMKRLLETIDDLATRIPYSNHHNMTISKSSVGWHIHHSILTIHKIINAISQSNPIDYKWKWNWTRSYVFTFNKIPRGKGQAPKIVTPHEVLDEHQLISEIDDLKSKIKILENLSPNHFFNHPYFGNLNLKYTTRFLLIHTNHHLEIIDEIINDKLKIATFKKK